LRSRGSLLALPPSCHPIAGRLFADCSPISTIGATARKRTHCHGACCGAPYCGGTLLLWETHIYSGGPERNMSLRRNQPRRSGKQPPPWREHARTRQGRVIAVRY
jgi:hypothetical protein